MSTSQSHTTAPPAMQTKSVAEALANFDMMMTRKREKEEIEALPHMLRLPAELRVQIYEHYIFDDIKNLPPQGHALAPWWCSEWDLQYKSHDRSYFRPILREMRILMNVCRKIREEVGLLNSPLTAFVLNVSTKQWKPMDPKILGSVWVRLRTSQTITDAKIRAMDQVKGWSECMISGGKEHHVGFMYFTENPELGVKVFKKDVRVGLGRRILGDDLGVMRDRPVEGVGKGIPVGLPDGVKVRRMFVRDTEWD